MHLSQFTGTLQADGYAGFDQLYETGRIEEAACWAHVRRKFYDLQLSHKSGVAAEALERIGALYAIEKQIQGARLKNGAGSATYTAVRCSYR
jgi:transposase